MVPQLIDITKHTDVAWASTVIEMLVIMNNISKSKERRITFSINPTSRLHLIGTDKFSRDLTHLYVLVDFSFFFFQVSKCPSVCNKITKDLTFSFGNKQVMEENNTNVQPKQHHVFVYTVSSCVYDKTRIYSSASQCHND